MLRKRNELRLLGEKVISWRRVGSAIGLASMLAAAGCADEALDPVGPSSNTKEGLPFEESLVPQTLLASITLADGNLIDFVETDGAIVMSANCLESDEDLVRAAFDLAGSEEPAAVYERLTGTPAPSALVAAQERVAVATQATGIAPSDPPLSDWDLEHGNKALPDGGPDAVIINTGVQSASTFINANCTDSVWDLVACWTDRNNNAWTNWRYSTYGRLGVAHCQSGTNLWHTFLKYDFALHTWTNVLPPDVISTGQSSWLFHWGGYGYYRAVVYNVNSWERYHLSFGTL